MENNKIDIFSKIEAVKNIGANGKASSLNLYNAIKEDLGASEGVMRRTIGDYQDKFKAKKTNQKDIFGEVLKVVESFIDTGADDTNNSKGKEKLRKYAQDSAKTTLHVSKQIVMDSVKSALFSGDGVCGANNLMFADSVTISPKEFDFLNMLLLSPDSTTGKIMYESEEDNGFVKMNTELYRNFNSGVPYVFLTKNGDELFTILWDDTTQQYTVSGLQGPLALTTVQEFITNYYSSIEYPNFDNIVNQSMLLAIQGDGTEPKSFTVGMDYLERLLQKLFSICGKQQTDSPLNQNAINQVNENDEDVESYFDFDDVEGIDLEEEDARARRVLKFRDCNNFEVPTNTNHIEDFVYFSGKKKNADENVTNTISKIAQETYENADQSITLEDLKISLTGLYLSKIPKALISAIVSPKIFLPIVITYKLFKSATSTVVLTVKEMMKKLSGLFSKIIKKLFWKFIKEFWVYAKKDLLNFVKDLAANIIKNKLKKWKTIITALISLLLKLLNTKIESCDAIFNSILATINGALSPKINIPIPGMLLALADGLPGYSADRAYMNAVQKLSDAGIPMGPLYGRDNKLNDVVKGILDGHAEEKNANGYVKIAMKFSQQAVTTPAGPGTITFNSTMIGCGKEDA